jgi:hypothetical protein
VLTTAAIPSRGIGAFESSCIVQSRNCLDNACISVPKEKCLQLGDKMWFFLFRLNLGFPRDIITFSSRLARKLFWNSYQKKGNSIENYICGHNIGRLRKEKQGFLRGYLGACFMIHQSTARTKKG